MALMRKAVYAIVNDNGIWMHGFQLDIYKLRKHADEAIARYNIAADGYFDGYVKRITLILEED